MWGIEMALPVKHKPTDKQIAASKEGHKTLEEAESARDYIEIVNDVGGLIIVRFQDVYYVCWGPDYFGGYKPGPGESV